MGLRSYVLALNAQRPNARRWEMLRNNQRRTHPRAIARRGRKLEWRADEFQSGARDLAAGAVWKLGWGCGGREVNRGQPLVKDTSEPPL